MDGIRTIDLGGPQPTRTALQHAAEGLHQACRTIGFLVLRNHGVPMQQVQAIHRQSLAFFARPDAEKLACQLRSPFGTRGFSPMGAENNARSLTGGGLPDLKEYFAMGRPYPSEEPLAEHAVPNAWPRQDGFGEAWRSYFHAMERLSERLNLLFAMALGVDENFFNRHTARHCSTLRAIHYPPQPDSTVAAGRMRSGEHTDFGSFTILWSDHQIGGLEVKHASGEWVAVQPVPDCFIVNIGDLMAQWTNDRFVSTLHRVANPTTGTAQARRLSLVYFQHPDADTLVSAVPTCIDPHGAPRHAPVLAGEHRRRKTALAVGPVM